MSIDTLQFFKVFMTSDQNQSEEKMKNKLIIEINKEDVTKTKSEQIIQTNKAFLNGNYSNNEQSYLKTSSSTQLDEYVSPNKDKDQTLLNINKLCVNKTALGENANLQNESKTTQSNENSSIIENANLVQSSACSNQAYIPSEKTLSECPYYSSTGFWASQPVIKHSCKRDYVMALRKTDISGDLDNKTKKANKKTDSLKQSNDEKYHSDEDKVYLPLGLSFILATHKMLPGIHTFLKSFYIESDRFRLEYSLQMLRREFIEGITVLVIENDEIMGMITAKPVKLMVMGGDILKCKCHTTDKQRIKQKSPREVNQKTQSKTKYDIQDAEAKLNDPVSFEPENSLGYGDELKDEIVSQDKKLEQNTKEEYFTSNSNESQNNILDSEENMAVMKTSSNIEMRHTDALKNSRKSLDNKTFMTERTFGSINFLCVHPKYRKKGLHLSLIKKIQAVLNSMNIYSAMFTCANDLKFSFNQFSYYHKILHGKWLQSINYSYWYFPYEKKIKGKLIKYSDSDFNLIDKMYVKQMEREKPVLYEVLNQEMFRAIKLEKKELLSYVYMNGFERKTKIKRPFVFERDSNNENEEDQRFSMDLKIDYSRCVPQKGKNGSNQNKRDSESVQTFSGTEKNNSCEVAKEDISSIERSLNGKPDIIKKSAIEKDDAIPGVEPNFSVFLFYSFDDELLGFCSYYLLNSVAIDDENKYVRAAYLKHLVINSETKENLTDNQIFERKIELLHTLCAHLYDQNVHTLNSLNFGDRDKLLNKIGAIKGTGKLFYHLFNYKLKGEVDYVLI